MPILYNLGTLNELKYIYPSEYSNLKRYYEIQKKNS